MENLAIDENTRNVLGAITNDSSELIKNLRVNPVTGRLIVDAHLTSTNTEMGDTIPGGTAGSVLFLGLGSTLAEDNANFFYDDTSNYLGLGTNTPSATLDLNGTFKYTDGNEALGYVLISDASGNAAWGDLSADTTFVTNLANDITFTTALVANTTFTTALALDTNFYTTLAGNTAFTTLLSGNVAVAVDGVTITGDGTTGNPLVAVTGGGGSVTSFSSGNLSPLFTTTVATATTTPALSFSLTNAGANTYFGNATGSTGAPTYTAAAALTKTDDTNVTLTLGGAPTTSLLTATSLTLGWTGQLSVARGGTGASSLTAYAVLCGGTTSTSPVQSVASVGTAGQVLTSNGAGALPTFQTPTVSGYIPSQYIFNTTSANVRTPRSICTLIGDNSVLWAGYQDGTAYYITRYELNDSGIYTATHTVTGSEAITSTYTIGIVALGSYVYVAYDTGPGTHKIRRFDAADLTNETAITVSGTNINSNAQNNGCFTDGTYLYFYDNTVANGNRNKYSVAGTTITFVSSIDFGTNELGAYSDGTHVYLLGQNGATIEKRDLTGTLVTTQYPNLNASTPNVDNTGDSSIGITYFNSSMWYIAMRIITYTDSAINQYGIYLLPIKQF